MEAVVNDEDSGSKLISIAATPANGRPTATGLNGGDVTLVNIQNDQTYTIQIQLDAPVISVNFPSLRRAMRCLGRSPRFAGCWSGRQPRPSLPPSLARACNAVPRPTGAGVRVTAFVPNALDARVNFAAGTTNDADAFLNLSAGNAALMSPIIGPTVSVEPMHLRRRAQPAVLTARLCLHRRR